MSSIVNPGSSTAPTGPSVVEGPVSAVDGNLAVFDGSTGKLIKDSGLAIVDLGGGVPTTRQINGHPLSADVTVTKGDVGLANVDNVADSAKPVSTAQQTALNAKQATLVSGTNIKTINSNSLLGAGDIVVGGGGLSDGDKGDITVGGSGTTLTIDPNVVTNAKLAQMATKTYKGRTAGTTGDPEDVAVATLKADMQLAKSDVGLGNVDNTSDANKPISTAEQTALNLKANLANPTLSGATLADATDVTINATTGSKIGQAGSKIGFYGVTPAVRPTALVQTYATASTTHAAVTQLAAPAGGVGVAAGGWSTAANRDLAITSINAARTDIANLKNFVNQIVDQLQALGLLQ